MFLLMQPTHVEAIGYAQLQSASEPTDLPT